MKQRIFTIPEIFKTYFEEIKEKQLTTIKSRDKIKKTRSKYFLATAIHMDFAAFKHVIRSITISTKSTKTP
tara:strand:+ start:620 stop:832 length:213 start_codon:yes stop_codon:yes gene_type:complete